MVQQFIPLSEDRSSPGSGVLLALSRQFSVSGVNANSGGSRYPIRWSMGMDCVTGCLRTSCHMVIGPAI